MEQGWKRHKHSCYTVTNQEQINEDARIGYYCHGPLLTVEDRYCMCIKHLYSLCGRVPKVFFSPPMFFHLNGRFEQAFVNSLLSASGANSSLYYWIGLMSTDDDGAYLWDHNTDPLAPLTYTNWNKHQPGSVLVQVCSSGLNTVVVVVVVRCLRFNHREHLSLFSCLLPSFFSSQSAEAAVLLCQVGLLWVGGR